MDGTFETCKMAGANAALAIIREVFSDSSWSSSCCNSKK